MVDLGQNVASKVPSGLDFFDVCCRLHKMKKCLECEMPFLASTKCLLLGLLTFCSAQMRPVNQLQHFKLHGL